MTFERIEALVRAAEGRGMAELEFSTRDATLAVRFETPHGSAGDRHVPDAAPAALSSETKSAGDPATIISPGVGVFRLAHPFGAQLPSSGGSVATGAVVAFVQAGPLLLPVIAARDGVLGQALVSEGTKVDYGMPLFDLDEPFQSRFNAS